MGMKINFGDVESGGQPVPEGDYLVNIERVEVRESNSSEHDYLNWEMSIQDEEYEDRRLWMITSLSPKALFRLKDVLLALDVIEEDEELEIDWDDDVDITPKEGPLVTSPDLTGLSAIATVHNEVYQNRERNRVDDLAPADTKPSAKRAKGNGKSGKSRQRKLK